MAEQLRTFRGDATHINRDGSKVTVHTVLHVKPDRYINQGDIIEFTEKECPK